MLQVGEVQISNLSQALHRVWNKQKLHMSKTVAIINQVTSNAGKPSQRRGAGIFVQTHGLLLAQATRSDRTSVGIQTDGAGWEHL